jgi:hypothetical protein
MLMGVHKMQGMASALTFLEWYHKDGNEFLHYIVWVTGDETQLSFADVETKAQSKQWMHIYSANKPKMFKKTLFAKKLMATVFWNRTGKECWWWNSCNKGPQHQKCIMKH